MGYLQNICDIEGAMLGTARFIHNLGVHVTRWRHDHNNVLPLFIEKERGITDLGTWQQEVVHGTQGVHRQIIDLFGRAAEEKQIWASVSKLKRSTVLFSIWDGLDKSTENFNNHQ